jgi:anaerobic selenocysteine-containing dehydrogenase
LQIPSSSLLDPAASKAAATPVAPNQALDPHDVWAMLLKGSPVPFEEIRTAVERKVFDRPPTYVQPKPEGWVGKLNIGADPMMAELAQIAAEPIGAADAYPYRMISRRMRDVLNSSWRDDGKLQRQFATNPAFMNPSDMETLGLVSGDIVELKSRRSSIRGVAQAASDVRTGCISMTHAWGGEPGEDDDPRLIGANTGRLTAVDEDFDPYSGIPRMSAIPVQVARV